MALVRDERAAWKVCWSSTAREAVREILTAALATDSNELRASARGVIDRLGSLGYLEFGDLVGVRFPG
jgi:DNA-binding phage protein